MSTADYGAILEEDDIISAAKDIVADMEGHLNSPNKNASTEIITNHAPCSRQIGDPPTIRKE